MIKEVADFIEKHIDLIDADKFLSLYRCAYNANWHKRNVGIMTDYLMSAGINPLEHMTEIPEYYLCGVPIENFDVPEGITAINMSAFHDCNLLRTVNIASTVKIIGDSAFENCSKLHTVSFAKGSQLKRLCLASFSFCASLRGFIVPYGCEQLEPYVFNGCANLKSIVLPDSIDTLERDSIRKGTAVYCKPDNEYVIDYCYTNDIDCMSVIDGALL